MFSPINASEKFDAYRNEITECFSRGKTPKALYFLAHLSLEELKTRLETDYEEPSEDDVARVAYRFDFAAQANDGVDTFDHLRARLVRAWMRPILWSEIINQSGLTDRKARNVATNVGLKSAGDESAAIIAEAIQAYDELDKLPKASLVESDANKLIHLAGFINEATPIQLGARHATSKEFALPSLAFDDRLNPDLRSHIDGFYFDNRKTQAPISKFPYHVGWHSHVSPHITPISATEMGNTGKSSAWGNDFRPFGTARRLVTERKGRPLSSQSKRGLDRVKSVVFNKIVRSHDSA